jgi:hypothetical protein
MKNDVLINTPNGIGKIEKIYVSELGFLMVKVAFNNGTYMGFNFGKHNPEDNIFTKELFKDELIGSPRS